MAKVKAVKEATQIKGATIFDFVDGVTHKKKEWSKWSESDQKKFSPFIVNRWLSMRSELIDLVNMLQKYTIGTLTPKETYRVYYEVLPQNKGFAKYIKGSKDDAYNPKLIDQIVEHYTVSKSEAVDYLDLLNADQVTKIVSLYGYTDAEIKTMIKGVKK
jgi:hypothetical protein